MRRWLFPLLSWLAVVAAPIAAGASGVEPARQEAAAARSKVNEVRARQMSLRSELNQVAAQIEVLKARQKGALLKRGELDSALRRSQELSGLLTQAAQEFSRAESELERGNRTLLGALSNELESLRRRWDQTRNRAARSELLRRMRELRAERAQVHAMLPDAPIPALAANGSEDPEDLLEQADALRDSEDKVRQQIRALESRIVEVRRERELERRMSDFLGEESLFDEQDRRLRRATSPSALFGAEADNASPPAPSSGSPTAAPSGGSTATAQPGVPTSRETAPPPTSGPSQTVAPQLSTFGADPRTVLGSGAPLIDEGDPRDLRALEEKLKKLQSLARQIDERADAVEARARDSR